MPTEDMFKRALLSLLCLSVESVVHAPGSIFSFLWSRFRVLLVKSEVHTKKTHTLQRHHTWNEAMSSNIKSNAW